MGVYTKKTWTFDITITVDGVAPDISGDTVTVYLDEDLSRPSPTVEQNADVTTSGASGVAKFTIAEDAMNINPAVYQMQVVWTLSSGDKFVVYDSTQEIKPVVKRD